MVRVPKGGHLSELQKQDLASRQEIGREFLKASLQERQKEIDTPETAVPPAVDEEDPAN